MVNAILIASVPPDGDVTAAVRSALRLEDLGVRVGTAGDPPMLAVESATGIVSEPLETADRPALPRLQVKGLDSSVVQRYALSVDKEESDGRNVGGAIRAVRDNHEPANLCGLGAIDDLAGKVVGTLALLAWGLAIVTLATLRSTKRLS